MDPTFSTSNATLLVLSLPGLTSTHEHLSAMGVGLGWEHGGWGGSMVGGVGAWWVGWV